MPARTGRALPITITAIAAGCLAGSLLAAVPAEARPVPSADGGRHLGRSTGVLSSRLLALAEPATARSTGRNQALALSLPAEGPGSLLRDAGGRVLVLARLADTSAATVAPLRQLGEVVNVSDPMSRATLRIAPDRLAELGGTPGVLAADLIPAPITGTASSAGAGPVAAASSDCRSVVSEADTQLRAAQARRAAGVDGAGVKIGVLSDSFDVADGVAAFAEHDVASGDLPGPGNPCGRTTPVQVLDELPAPTSPNDPVGTDEGRAMLQLVHDLAPGSPLAFATAFTGPDQFAANIRALEGAGAKVIVDDVSYFTEPFFQSGVIDQAAADVTAQGVSYFSSAGNSNLVLGGADVSSWETPTARLAPCPTVTDEGSSYPIGVSCVDFDPTGTADTGYGLTIGPGGVVAPVIQWAEPVNGVTTDFDAYLVDASGAILSGSEGIQVGTGATGEPVEFFGWQNPSATATVNARIVIARYAGTNAPRLKVALVQTSGVTGVEYHQSRAGDVVGPTIFGHNGGDAVVSVGAVPYDNASRVESFSSRGPVTHYFGPVTGTTPADALPAARVIAAPDLVATDGVATTFFAQRIAGAWRFYGTSAAAPNAAAVAALLRQKQPSLTPAQVLARLTATTVRVGAAPATAAGAGMVDALFAVAGITAPSAPKVLRTVAARGGAAVSFAAPTSNGGSPLTSYAATCRSSNGGTARSITRTGASTAALSVSGLTAGRSYRCTVRATNAFRTGPSSAAGPAAVPTGLPSRPGKPQVRAGHKVATVSFRAPAETGGLSITRYTATCVPVKAGKTRSRSGTGTTLKVKRLKANAQYRCTVVATNSLGDGPRSAKSAKVRTRA